ncbi:MULTISPECIES: molecular chaperone DnaJ [Pirellulaceae]|uniref:Chaperone protein DnaJ n=1 Tax=Aporhodopirellula rubra TaxID=980271 RepID=A0A7W5E3W0_9BACT|nr:MULTISPECIES: molecular chaperone DnaJ [Pirellulaceae]EMI43990.1 chaperone protein DnaJ [Rhodopirellula sp. SWK7]MBB3209628.1 molecular chaperone DnaJ [Aporhodopirellula rubra]
MATKTCYYEILNVERSSTKQQIDRAYRKLAIKYHPDTNKDESAVALFKEATEAYEVLSDQNKRARYDQYGHAGVEGATHQYNDVEDIFEAFGDLFGGGGFGDFFGGGSRRGGGGRRRVRRGADIRCDVTLTLEEAARGCHKDIAFRRRVACETCSGSGAAPGSEPVTCTMCGGQGQVIQSAGILRVQTTCPTCQGAGKQISQPCGECRGTGLQNERAELNVEIPAGVDDGMRVRLQGEGEPSPDGGPAGDCYCFIAVKPHNLFKRDGKHLILQLPISYAQAALGAEIEVPTLNGPHQLTVPAGTQSGDVFTVRGQGIVDHRSGRNGDLLVQVFIEVPKKLNAEQEKLLRQLADLDHEAVLPERTSFLDKLRHFFDPEPESTSETKSS